MNNKIVKVFGLVANEKGIAKEFNGEIVKVDDDGFFLFENEIYKPHQKQTEIVSLLYPNVIWVKEPSLDVDPLNPEELLLQETEISNCYARRGSHWIKYFIDPKSLILCGEDDEEQAEIKALEVADIIVSKARLKQVLEDVGITDPKIIQEILLTL